MCLPRPLCYTLTLAQRWTEPILLGAYDSDTISDEKNLVWSKTTVKTSPHFDSGIGYLNYPNNLFKIYFLPVSVYMIWCINNIYFRFFTFVTSLLLLASPVLICFPPSPNSEAFLHWWLNLQAVQTSLMTLKPLSTMKMSSSPSQPWCPLHSF